MLNEAVRKMLRLRADQHHEVATACASEPDLTKAVHHRSTSDSHAAAAARIQPARAGRRPTATQKAELAALAQHHDRLSVAHSAKPDLKAASTHAHAAEGLRAVLEDRPARTFASADLLVHLGLREPPLATSNEVENDSSTEEADNGKRRARAQG